MSYEKTPETKMIDGVPARKEELYADPEAEVEILRQQAIEHLHLKNVEIPKDSTFTDIERAFELAAQKHGRDAIYRGEGGYYDDLLEWHETKKETDKAEQKKEAV